MTHVHPPAAAPPGALDADALIRALEGGSLDPSAFDHRAHVQAAWGYLRRAPFGLAGHAFASALRRFAAAIGKPDRYHETITWAYLALIQERCATGGPRDFDAFARESPDLLDHRGGIVSRLYGPETMASELARRVFVLPR